MTLLQLLTEGDGVSRAVALLLLAMSVGSWVVILWKTWLLRQAASGLARGVAAFWQAGTLDQACAQLPAFDRQTLLLPLVQAARSAPTAATLAAAGAREAQLTRALRDALHAVLRRLQSGQTLLATVGATAPFVGLLGTVWAIYLALTGVAHGPVGIEHIAGPVGSALVMTAAGLAVAIPAVLAYNALGRVLTSIEAELEGFAHDLRELLASQAWSVDAEMSAAGPSQGAKAPSGGSAVHAVTSVGA